MILIPGLSRSLDTVGKRASSRLTTQKADFLCKRAGSSNGRVAPKCERRSSRVHGRYWRWLSDTPSFGRPVLLVVEARRFKCINSHCPQQTFSERIDLLAATGQRRTMRLRDAPLAGVFARRRRCRQASGAPGNAHEPPHGAARLRGAGCPGPVTAPFIIGIDDCAMTRGHRYGTMV